VKENPLDTLAKLLAKLPGIGEKTGARLAYFLWRAQGKYPEDLARAILEVKEKVTPCPVCGKPATTDPCEICRDTDRDRTIIMVVEEPQDLAAIEKISAYHGTYHVIGGVLSPVAGVGPEDLNIRGLLDRVKATGLKEVILATNPSVEGDATAAFLEEEIGKAAQNISVTRLARGIPVGSKIKYMDPASIEHAVASRTGKLPDTD